MPKLDAIIELDGQRYRVPKSVKTMMQGAIASYSNTAEPLDAPKPAKPEELDKLQKEVKKLKAANKKLAKENEALKAGND